MNKKFRRGIILSILVLVAVFVTLFLQKPTEKEDDDKFDEVPLTDLASTYEGKATDENGNLLAPFDVVYPEAFNSGEYKYDENYVLLKFDNSFNGKLTERLEKCGIVNLSSFMTGVDGTWYKCKIGYDTDVKTVVMKTRSLSEVLVADFDYIYEQTADEVQVGPEDGGPGPLHEKVQKNEKAADQWYLKASGIQEAWKYLEKEGIEPGGSSSVVVAVIDTGVDYNHDDLKANMWVNTAEIAGNGIDDDGNGYIDDIHGANVIANNGILDTENIGDPMDDNGHGTHVAGIIAASNNKIGVVGIAYNAKIMAVKAGQATGVFLQSDIAEAILYAYQMGAEVINMSFGGPSCSIAVQDALTQAYTTATLVASAGNDAKPNDIADFFKKVPEYQPNYPAALSYVIGVMSVDERDVESSFSNWDARVFDSIEYEVYAPGERIMSTLPNNNYGKLSGTSMAAPVVSGIAALLRSYYTDRDMYPSKFITAQLCATSEDMVECVKPELHTVDGFLHNIPMVVNAHKSLTKMPKPDVGIVEFYIFDDPSISAKNNGDGIADAGETLHISPVLRNRWGMSKDTVVTLDAFTNKELNLVNPYVEIINGTVNYEGVGTYSTKDYLAREGSLITGCENPFIVKIADNCPNDYLINFNATITYGNALDSKDKTEYVSRQSSSVSFWVRNGVVLPRQITEDMILTKDNYYIIPSSTYIAEGVTVTVEEGTKIQFWTDDPNDPYANSHVAYLMVDGCFITEGTLKEPVSMFPSDYMESYLVEIKRGTTGYVDLNYTTVTNPFMDIDFADHCTFNQNTDKVYTKDTSGNPDETFTYFKCSKITNSIFYKLKS